MFLASVADAFSLCPGVGEVHSRLPKHASLSVAAVGVVPGKDYIDASLSGCGFECRGWVVGFIFPLSLGAHFQKK